MIAPRQPAHTEFDRAFPPFDWDATVRKMALTKATAVLRQRQAALTDYRQFVNVFVPDLSPNWHIDEITATLDAFVEAVERKLSPRLIIALPPRAGKSELTSRKFPPYLLGRHPEWEVICASATQPLAEDFGSNVRATLADPIFKEMFPDTEVDRSTNAKDRIITRSSKRPLRPGGYKAIGVGGMLSGFGGHCLTAGTLIATDQGQVPLRKLVHHYHGVKVLAYDVATGGLAHRPIQAVSRRRAQTIYRIATVTGKVVRATGEHPIYTRRGWIPAGELAIADVLVGLKNPVHPHYNGGTQLEGLTSISREPRDRGVWVYNLQVEGEHNYFANGILTHNCIIADDLLPGMTEADSEATRRATMMWYDSVFSARLAPGGGIILVGTRWHEEDPIGTVLARAKKDPRADQWMLYSYPAVAKVDEPHRKKGEVLHPARFTQREMDQRRASLIPRAWNAVYQQSPAPEDGDYFRAKWFKFHPPAMRPPGAHWYIAFDAAVSTSQAADYSVIAPVARTHDGTLHFSNEILRERLTAKELIEAVLDRAAAHKALAIVGEKGVIDRALRPFLDEAMKRRHQYFPVLTFANKGDKPTRARTLQGMMQTGLVSFPDTPLVHEDLVPEFLSFPNAKHDDFVDACALVAMNLQRLVQAPEASASTSPTLRPIAHGVAYVVNREDPTPAKRQEGRGRHVPKGLRAR